MQRKNTISNLKDNLRSLTDQLAHLIKDVPIGHINRFDGNMVWMGPEYYWAEPSPESRNLQLKIRQEYDQWAELLHLILSNAPKDITRNLDEADKTFRKWLELESNWSLTQNQERNEQVFREETTKLVELLNILEVGYQEETIVIPDTNSLLAAPEPKAYRTTIDTSDFVFLLLPTVLGELDNLKLLHRNPDVREKAKKMITRIKGWRNQGSLVNGVTVDRSITVKAKAKEPNTLLSGKSKVLMATNMSIIAGSNDTNCKEDICQSPSPVLYKFWKKS